MEYQGIDAFVWPQPASAAAAASDALAAELAWSGVAFVAVLVFGLLVAVARPWRSRWPLGLWAAALLTCLAPIAWHAAQRSADRASTPKDPLTIEVHAYPYRWEFVQPNGMTSNVLHVPVDRPVRLRMTSRSNTHRPEDATVHGFSVPAFRVRADIVPGRVTEARFRAASTGSFQIFCDGFCGVGHHRMLSTVEVMALDDYEAPTCNLDWTPADPKDSAERGRWLFHANGCPACHAVDRGPPLHGPNLADVAGHARRLEGGRTIVAKADYLRRAIESPRDDIVEGYTSVAMPAFILPRSDLDALVAYVASLSDRGDAVIPSEPPYEPTSFSKSTFGSTPSSE